MTNHDEAAGWSGDMYGKTSDSASDERSGERSGDTSDNGFGGGRVEPTEPAGRFGGAGRAGHGGTGQYTGHGTPEPDAPHGILEPDSPRGAPEPDPATDAPGQHAGHGAPGGPCGEHQVTLRTPAELADALPYLLGYRPEDSIVLVALHDGERRGRFGGRARLGIPANAEDWSSVAEQLAQGLVKGSERRGARPESMVAYLCQEPAHGESGREVMERLRSLAQLLRTACGRLDVPVIEALCISDGRFWSYCCPGQGCCSPEGESMGLPGTSVLAAAATYAGLQVRGTLRELTARLVPWETAVALDQEAALDTASMALVPRILDGENRAAVAKETLELAQRVMVRFTDAPPVSGTRPADLRDDGLVEHEEAATLILGLQDRTTRDRAAEWMEGEEAGPALRLWRALARRCVGPYREHAAAPLTLAGWVAWSTGDELEAREALAMALGADPDYLFARLLHQACNEGLDPESVRRCLRAERTDRVAAGTEQPRDLAAPFDAAEPAPGSRTAGTGAGPVAGPGVGPVARSQSLDVVASSTDFGSVEGAAPPSVTPARRRRRARPTGSGDARQSRRAPGGGSARRRRPTEGGSPAGDGPGRAAEGASSRSRNRREGGRHGAEEDT
ncbi:MULTISPECIES: DUF4192 family protein [unclassified Streptomyces]|uniref:DUF4192 domain-containing protein n=1 Tax=unclassified Streptomyces TaxID=2593676 RepID=UPI003867DD37|nr:DUF4192 family protein [Streptomyces sp. NBC_00827]